jgi:hypothetical protein
MYIGGAVLLVLVLGCVLAALLVEYRRRKFGTSADVHPSSGDDAPPSPCDRPRRTSFTREQPRVEMSHAAGIRGLHGHHAHHPHVAAAPYGPTWS